MRRGAAFAAAAVLAAAVAAAKAPGPGEPRVVAALSQNTIAITAAFDGSEIFVYGAIAREAPPSPQDADLGVVVKIVGPSEPVVVRRKARILGIWANRDAAFIDAAPTFYAIATTGPLYETISHTEDLRLRVSLERAMRFVGAQADLRGRQSFLDAVARLRRDTGLYVVNPGGVELIEGTLFRTNIVLPANITEGLYRAQILLTRDREVIDVFETEIDVARAGLERAIYDLAQQQPLLYGLASIAVALTAGFAASAVFRYIRG